MADRIFDSVIHSPDLPARTAEELASLLLTMPPDAPVYLEGCDGCAGPAMAVDLDKNGRVLITRWDG